MSANCLVTKLKSEVNNEALEFFDALQFKIDWTGHTGGTSMTLFNGSQSKMLFGGVGVKVIVISNGEIRESSASPGSGSSEYVIPDAWTSVSNRVLAALDGTKTTEFLLVGLSKITHLYPSYSNLKIIVRNPELMKYCTSLTLGNPSAGKYTLPIFYPYLDHDKCDISDYIAGFAHKADVTDLQFYSTITGVSTSFVTGSQAFVGYDSLTAITRNARVDYGRLADFADLTSLTTIALGMTGSTRGVTGNITSLAKLTALTAINMNNTKVEGSLENFAAAQYAQGRTSASSINIRGPYLTYEDDGETKYVGTNPVTLSWTDGGEGPEITIE